MESLTIDVAEAAHRLDVSPSTIHRLIRKGQFPPAVKLGHWRVNVDQLDEWRRAGGNGQVAS